MYSLPLIIDLLLMNLSTVLDNSAAGTALQAF
jgi:hypothetical protein